MKNGFGIGKFLVGSEGGEEGEERGKGKRDQRFAVRLSPIEKRQEGGGTVVKRGGG